MENQDVIYGINGPVVTVKNTKSFSMLEMVYVGNDKLVGEVIGINEKFTTIQVYEETTGLKPLEPVEKTGQPMTVTLGPGILDNIFDGIQRPLKDIEKASGAFIKRGASVNALDENKLWDVTIDVKKGDVLSPGQVYAQCNETSIIRHKCMVPPNISGEVISVAKNGKYSVNDTVVTLRSEYGT